MGNYREHWQKEPGSSLKALWTFSITHRCGRFRHRHVLQRNMSKNTSCYISDRITISLFKSHQCNQNSGHRNSTVTAVLLESLLSFLPGLPKDPRTLVRTFFSYFFHKVCMETNIHAENEPPVRIFRHGRRTRRLSADSDSAAEPQQQYTMCVSCNFRQQGMRNPCVICFKLRQVSVQNFSDGFRKYTIQNDVSMKTTGGVLRLLNTHVGDVCRSKYLTQNVPYNVRQKGWLWIIRPLWFD